MKNYSSPEEKFYITEIDDELFARIYGKSYKPECDNLPDIDLRAELRYLHLLYTNFEGRTEVGELIVNKHIAGDVLEIFRTLYEAGYALEKVRLIDDYEADDESSMADNNSSAFNFRYISYTKRISKHGLGLAVDINPLYNPYIKTVAGRLSIEPANAAPYVERSGNFPHKLERGEFCCELFCKHGFIWGGDWTESKDYQHFDVSNEAIAAWYPTWARE